MPYDFAYFVKDEYSDSDFTHQESSDGKSVSGSYSVVLPYSQTKVNYGHNSKDLSFLPRSKTSYPEPDHPKVAYPKPVYPNAAYPQAEYEAPRKHPKSPVYPKAPANPKAAHPTTIH